MSSRFLRAASLFIVASAVSGASAGLGDLLNKANTASSDAQQAQQDANTAKDTAKALKKNKKNKPQTPDGTNNNNSSSNNNGQASADASKPGGMASLNAKATETLLGAQVTNNSMNRMVVSDDGQHVMLVNSKGSRMMMMVDGTAGPVFDEFPGVSGTNLTAAFSPDGKHSAYVGLRGNQYIPVVDGKEQPPIGDASKGTGIAPINPQHNASLLYSDDGQLAYISSISSTATGQAPTYQVVLNGKAGDSYAQVDHLMFVNNKLVYVARTSNQDPDCKVISDGKAVPLGAVNEQSEVILSRNGLHYAIRAGSNIVVDGTAMPPSAPGSVTQLTVADDGRVAYIWREDRQDSVLFVNGQKVANAVNFFINYPQAPGVNSSVANYSNLAAAFSPDGKRIAYVTKSPTGETAVIDGKPELLYEQVGDLQFSPDSKHYFYVGHKGISSFLIYDGTEMDDPYQGPLFIGPNGTHWMYQSWNGSQAKMVVDSKPMGPYGGITGTAVAFSPDGNHYAFAAISGFQKQVVVIDGKSKEIGQIGRFSTNNLLAWSDVVFSPDSQHTAYIAPLSNGTGQSALYVDDKPWLQGGSFTYPSFTPDGKHFSVITMQNQIVNGVGHLITGPIIDSKMGPTYDSMIQTNKRTAGFIDNHTYSFLAVKDKSIYRVTIDIGS